VHLKHQERVDIEQRGQLRVPSYGMIDKMVQHVIKAFKTPTP
jgi:hypothetical protein